MTIADQDFRSPDLAMPPRPKRPLSNLKLIRVARRNSLAACDEQLFDELIVERRFLWFRSIIISDPEGIRRVMLDNLDNYPRLPQMARVLGPGLGEGLLTAGGETWRRHRRLMTPTLDGRSVVSYAPMIAELAHELVQSLSARPPGEYFNIADEVTGVLIGAVARLFGDRQIVPLLVSFLENTRGRRVLDFIQAPAWLQDLFYGRDTLRDAGHAFDALVYQLITERRDPSYRGEQDLLWRLTNASDRNSGESLSDREVRDEAVTLALGAIDTTMRALTWIWYLLAMHPWAEARLHVELDEVLGDRSPTADDLPQLVYLRKLIDETMRLYPPIPVMMRIAADDDVVGGHTIPRGSLISIMPWVVHRHRKLWTDPDHVDPERFGPEQSAARHRFAYIPFALGPHICIGASLAMMEMLTIVSILAQRFRFRLKPDREVSAVGGFLTLRVDGGLWMSAEPRAAPTETAWPRQLA